VSIMTLPPLTIATTPTTALMHQRGSLTTGIVHLGLGNFHRAHQAVYTAAALAEQDGPWGILGVASRSGAIAAAMRAQDLRYGVLEISPHSSKVTIPAVHTGAIVAADDPNVVVDAIGNPGTAIVTLTVTETVAGGFLAMYSAATTQPSTSSINWFANNQTFAVSTQVAVDAAGQVKITAGSSSTQFLIDVTGYLF